MAPWALGSMMPPKGGGGRTDMPIGKYLLVLILAMLVWCSPAFATCKAAPLPRKGSVLGTSGRH